MPQFKKYKLGDLMDVQNGYAFKSEDLKSFGTPIIKIKNIQPPDISFAEVDYYPHELNGRLNHFIVKKNDILISMTGSHVSQIASAVGKVGRYGFDIPALLNQRVGKLFSKDDSKLNNDYLYYFIARPEIQFELATNAGGSANQANISPQDIKDLEIELPDIPTQTRIASILSSLDDKIELNRRTNHTLEQIAQSLFKKYFVEDIDPEYLPEGWRWGKLGEIVDITSSKRIFLNEYVSTGVPFFRGKEIIELHNGGIISTELFITHNKFEEIKCKFGIPKKGDILLTSVGTIGVPYLVPDNRLFYFKDGNLTWVRNYFDYVGPYFLYQWLVSDEGQYAIKNITIGSTQQAITIQALKNLSIIIPPKGLVESISKQFKTVREKISSNMEEVKLLTKIRDSFLPKLMSGEIEVNVEEKMSEAELAG